MLATLVDIYAPTVVGVKTVHTAIAGSLYRRLLGPPLYMLHVLGVSPLLPSEFLTKRRAHPRAPARKTERARFFGATTKDALYTSRTHGPTA